MDFQEQLTGIREDVSYIRAKVEQLPDHEERIRKLERRWLAFPGSLVVALLGLLGIHLN